MRVAFNNKKSKENMVVYTRSLIHGAQDDISEGVKIHGYKNTDGNKKNLTPMAKRLLVRDGHPFNTKKCCVYCKGNNYFASYE